MNKYKSNIYIRKKYACKASICARKSNEQQIIQLIYLIKYS